MHRSRIPAARFLVSLFGLMLLLPAAEAQRKHRPPVRTPSAASTLSSAINQLLGDRAISRAHWGISIRTLDGKTVYALNDSHLMHPASNAKLFTTATAFALLPANAVYVTHVVAEGNIDAAGTLHGAIAILGAGDPSMSGRVYPYGLHTERPNPPLAAFEDLADQIVHAGIHAIDGSVIGDDTFYPLERYGTGWASDDLVWLYGAPVSALTINDNAVFLNVLPATPAPDPAAAAGSSAPTAPTGPWNPATVYYTLDNTARFAPAHAASHPGLDRQPGSLSVRLFGTLPADGYHAGISLEDPAEYAAKSLTEMLKVRGVAVTGQASARHRVSNNTEKFAVERGQPLTFQPVSITQIAAPTGNFRVLATHKSPPLSEDWTVTNKASQNLHAELALRTLGKLYGSDGSFAQGTRVVRQFLENAGLDPGDFFFYDGSGLSTSDLITARAATQLLVYAAHQGWGEAYRATLPIGGTDGSLSARFTSATAKGHVFAKTGTLNEVNALSGYVEAASGKMLTFSILVNAHTPESNALPVMDAIVEAIIAKD